MKQSIYEKEGYKDREDYLKVLSEEYNLSFETVLELADKVGSRAKEFTELICTLDELAYKLKKEI